MNGLKYNIQSNNRGAVSIEASLILPLFLFTMLFFINAAEIYRTKAVIYEGSIEAAEYVAEYAYLGDRFLEGDGKEVLSELSGHALLVIKFGEYVDDMTLLEKYVIGGKNGVSFLGSSLPDDSGYIDMKISYFLHLNIPLIGNFRHLCQEHIRQRAYLGFRGSDNEEEKAENDTFVYVAKNGVVYHTRRSCTYLLPDIHSTSRSGAVASGYSPCEYCGAASGSSVYITPEGDRYHSSRSCSRLARTVERKKLSEINLPACSKCGGN